MAISRCRYSVPAVARLAKHGQDAYRDWARFTGLDQPRSDYVVLGGLWMFDLGRLELETEQAMLAANGVASAVVDVDELHRRWPNVNPCVEPVDLSFESAHVCRDGEAFLFEEYAGIVDPVGANQDLLEAAERHDVDVRFRTRAAGLVSTSAGVEGIELSDGSRIMAPIVLNAAGPWCNELNEMAAAALPWTLTPTRMQVVYRPWPVDGPRFPILFDGSTSGGVRLEANGQQVVIGTPEVPRFAREADPDTYRKQADADAIEITLAGFEHRVTGVEHRGSVIGTSGLYTINKQDTHPVVGPSEVAGLWLANGFSGHGLKLAPMIGSLLAQRITGVRVDDDTDVSLDLFSNERELLDTSGIVFA